MGGQGHRDSETDIQIYRYTERMRYRDRDKARNAKRERVEDRARNQREQGEHSTSKLGVCVLES